MNNKPLNKFRDKSISITIWPGKTSGYQCKVLKEYKAKDSSEWKRTDSYFPDELERLEKLCADARRGIHEHSKDMEHSEAKANAYQPPAPTFNDDDIPW